jgi:hypothetical protein
MQRDDGGSVAFQARLGDVARGPWRSSKRQAFRDLRVVKGRKPAPSLVA